MPSPAVKGAGWGLEAALDIQWSHTMAPAAAILVVETAGETDYDLISLAANYARSVPGVAVVSMSFGKSETTSDSALNAVFTTPEDGPDTCNPLRKSA